MKENITHHNKNLKNIKISKKNNINQSHSSFSKKKKKKIQNNRIYIFVKTRKIQRQMDRKYF